ncbi:hypothetical protein BHM03_00002749 [Ensete ventricosum]|nr:hypothetical protein BHM03_00002749 [Ensete ventricosum]
MGSRTSTVSRKNTMVINLRKVEFRFEKVSVIKIFLLLSSPIIIVTSLVFRWPLMKLLYGRKCRMPICWEEVGNRKLFCR